MKDFANKLVKNFAEICFDEFFDEIAIGLDLGSNLNDEMGEEAEEQEEIDNSTKGESTDVF